MTTTTANPADFRAMDIQRNAPEARDIPHKKARDKGPAWGRLKNPQAAFKIHIDYEMPFFVLRYLSPKEACWTIPRDGDGSLMAFGSMEAVHAWLETTGMIAAKQVRSMAPSWFGATGTSVESTEGLKTGVKKVTQEIEQEVKFVIHP